MFFSAAQLAGATSWELGQRSHPKIPVKDTCPRLGEPAVDPSMMKSHWRGQHVQM